MLKLASPSTGRCGIECLHLDFSNSFLYLLRVYKAWERPMPVVRIEYRKILLSGKTFEKKNRVGGKH